MASTENGAVEFPVDKLDAKKAIGELIQKEGLEKITSSKIRAHLKTSFNTEFDEFKKDIDQLTKEVIENTDKTPQSENIAQPRSEAPPTPSASNGNGSDSDSSDPGVASSDRARPKKKAVKRKASADLDDDADVDLMSAVKSRSRQRAAAKQANQILKKTGVRGSRKKDDGDGKKKDNSGKFGKMTKLCLISDELQVITSKKFMKRCDVVKEMWDYVKRYDLFDPKDKRFAICDDTLFTIFKKKRFRVFSMMKEMNKHVMDPQQIGGEVWEESQIEKARLIAAWQARQDAEAAGHSGSVPDDDEGGEEEEKDKSSSAEPAAEPEKDGEAQSDGEDSDLVSD